MSREELHAEEPESTPPAVHAREAETPLPEVLRPSWFILLVPPSLIYVNGIALYPDFVFVETIFYFGLVLAAALLLYARSFWRWTFGPPWWAFTFPLDALAYAAARYAQDHPGGPWRAIAGAALLLVSRAEAPLGIVYRSDAVADQSVVTVAAFSDTTHPPIVYPAALTTRASAAAGNVLGCLRGDAARAEFKRQGFDVIDQPAGR